jgi:general nucleoside transport system ATP-binding protein
VIRRGKVIGTVKPAEADQNKLASMMVGRDVKLELEKADSKPGEVVLKVENLLVTDDAQQVSVENVSFEVKAGEILGIAGVQGNGQTELVEAITGMRKVDDGLITLMGKDVTHATPRAFTESRDGTYPRGPPARRAGISLSGARKLDLVHLLPVSLRQRTDHSMEPGA